LFSRLHYGSLALRPAALLALLVGADRVRTQPTRTFTSGLPMVWSPAPSPDITTAPTGKLALAGLSPARSSTSFTALTGQCLESHFKKLKVRSCILFQLDSLQEEEGLCFQPRSCAPPFRKESVWITCGVLFRTRTACLTRRCGGDSSRAPMPAPSTALYPWMPGCGHSPLHNEMSRLLQSADIDTCMYGVQVEDDTPAQSTGEQQDR